ncbi:glycosyltransferase family protein [Salinimicrobium sp. CAU 1759]
MKASEQKKILVVAESIDVEDSSGSKANVALILNLKDAGYEILVYHYTRKEIQLPDIRCVAIKEKKFNLLFLLSRAQRKIQHRFHLNLAKHLEPVFGFSFTFFNDTKSIAEAIEAEKDFKPNLVLTLSKGTSFRPHFALLKVPRLHKKWMAYVHDPYPFHIYPEPYTWSEPGYKQRMEFFREVAEKCRWAAFPSLLLKEWMQKHYVAFKEKGVVIPHQLRDPEKRELELPEYFEPEMFNLLHAGNLMKQRPPFYLIEAFQKFLAGNPEARKKSRLLLLGNASCHSKTLKKYEEEILQLYVSKGYVAYTEVQEMQNQASVNIILESRAAESPFLPGKFPHCLAAGKQILLLGPKKSETRRLLGSDYLYWSELNDVECIAGLIEKLYHSWRKDPENFYLYREDLKVYLSKDYLKKELDQILKEY